MTPEEFALEYFQETDSAMLALASRAQWFECMKSYARRMCDEQKKLCADDAELGGSGYSDISIERDTILEAPYPKELQ